MGTRTPWSLATTGASPEIYYFEANPKQDGGSLGTTKSPYYAVTAGPSGATVLHEAVDDPIRLQYSGVLVTENQYNALLTWFDKEDPVTLTDDLGRSFLVYLDALDYTRAPKRHYPFRHEFSFTAYVLERL